MLGCLTLLFARSGSLLYLEVKCLHFTIAVFSKSGSDLFAPPRATPTSVSALLNFSEKRPDTSKITGLTPCGSGFCPQLIYYQSLVAKLSLSP
jgi:hypothetical protein